MAKMYENRRHQSSRAGYRKAQNFEHLKEKTEAELLDMLTVLLDEPQSAPCDTDALDAILDALEEIAPLTDIPDPHVALETFQEQHALLIPRQTDSPLREKIVAPVRHSSRRKRRGFFSVLAAILVLFCSMVTAQAFGLNIFGAIAQWTSETFRFESDEVSYAKIKKRPLADGETATYASLQEALDAFGIDAPLAPTWVPERFGEPKVMAENRAGGVRFRADYAAGDEILFIQFTEIFKENAGTIEKDLSGMELYSCGDIPYYILNDQGIQKITWKNGAFECRITGNITREETNKVIDSICKGLKTN